VASSIKLVSFRAIAIFVSFISCTLLLATVHFGDPAPNIFGFLTEFNPVYWIGLFFLALSTISWYKSCGNLRFGFFLLELWVAYLFLIPIVGQPLASGRDTWEHLFAINQLSNHEVTNVFSNEASFSPGFYIFERVSMILTGIGYEAYPKVFLGYTMYFVTSIILLLFGRLIFAEPNNQVLFGLAGISFLWVPLLSVPSPEFYGLLLLILATGALLKKGRSPTRDILVFATIIAAIIISHVLVSFILMGETFVIWIYNMYSGIPHKTSKNDFYRFLVTAILFTGYYSLFPAFLSVSFQSVVQGLLNPLGTSPLYVARTSYQAESIDISVMFLLVLIVWFVVGLVLVKGRIFRSEMIPKILLLSLPLLLIPFTGAYSNEGFLRIFFLGIPLEAALLITLTSRSKFIGLAFVIVLLMLSLPVRYSHQYVEYVPSGEINGSTYLSSHVVGEVGTLWPRAKPMAAGSLINSTLLSNELDVVPYQTNMIEGVLLAMKSPLDENLILWFDGSATLYSIENTYYAPSNDLVYAGNDFWVYFMQQPVNLRV
jgi:hypothetical protein